MHRVYIPFGNYHIDRQIPKLSNNIIGDCEFVFDENVEYDYFVTLDGLGKETECKVDKAHRLLFLGEPPYVKQYNDGFINQYGHVFSCQKRKVEKGQANRHFPLLPWMLGISLKENSHSALGNMPFLTYDDFKKMSDDSERINKCCLISSKKIMTKGHRDRVRFANCALMHHSDIIDVYGNGYNSIPDKLDILQKYKYAIVIENCQYHDYWTEKIGDCFLAGCYPIYHGCPNIEEYFPKESYTEINVRNITEAIDKIKSILDSNLFEESTDKLKEAKDLVLDEYNIFPQIVKRISEIEKDKKSIVQKGDVCAETLLPMRLSFIDKVKQLIAWKFNILI